MIKEQEFVRQLGIQIAQLRKDRKVSQEKLADMVGVRRTYIGFIEQGVRNPSIGNIFRIAKALKVDIKDLF
ncbi:helix-turn-helix transcriptional regulator [Candidatus Saccharibacteria bacterium]|nr:helix-turn-helix transcriptional regulator [Candidatus Saccharibacteria bacterium]